MIFWLILGGLIILLGVGIWLERTSYKWDDWGRIIAIAAGIFLGSVLLVWPCSYAEEISNIIGFKSALQTVENSRIEELDPIERAAIQQKIIECNVWLAQAQYWNQYFDPMYPDEVMELEPIR
jgi:hypothetical protein